MDSTTSDGLALAQTATFLYYIQLEYPPGALNPFNAGNHKVVYVLCSEGKPSGKLDMKWIPQSDLFSESCNLREGTLQHRHERQ
mmetsp:Transcript_3096/g.19081  ORF Transcript_3096/g.19081 Transcript_3096/m.19081 type:complete len:84 (-) Transcript_3096:2889-3140(-)